MTKTRKKQKLEKPPFAQKTEKGTRRVLLVLVPPSVPTDLLLLTTDCLLWPRPCTCAVSWWPCPWQSCWLDDDAPTSMWSRVHEVVVSQQQAISTSSSSSVTLLLAQGTSSKGGSSTPLWGAHRGHTISSFCVFCLFLVFLVFHFWAFLVRHALVVRTPKNGKNSNLEKTKNRGHFSCPHD